MKENFFKNLLNKIKNIFKGKNNTYNDGLLKFLMDNGKEGIEKRIRTRAYENSIKDYADAIKKESVAGKMLVENGYDIFTPEQANQDFRNLLKLDKINEIAGVYKTFDDEGNETHNIIAITKSNYWNAFYSPVWENLSTSERIKAFEWMFEDLKRTYNLNVSLTYFPFNKSDVSYTGLYSEQEYKDKTKRYVYLNLYQIDDQYEFAMTIAHELTHARQYKFADTVNTNLKNDFYTMSMLQKYYINDFDEENLTKPHIQFGLYVLQDMEKAANLQGLKTIIKYKKLNEQVFGEDDFEDEKINEMKRTYLRGDLYKDKSSYGILYNNEIIFKKQSKNILKMMMLKNDLSAKYWDEMEDMDIIQEQVKECNKKYKDKLFSLEKFDTEISALLVKKLELRKSTQKYMDKIQMINAIIDYTIENGKLPENFDLEEEMKELNVKYEPESEHILPKWLRKEENEYLEELEELKY